MASCPKCGKKLTLLNLSQFCPSCGVNMRFYNFEENFYREAKISELSQAAMHVKIRRLKASFIGSKLTIARLCVMLLAVASLLIETGSFTITLPFLTKQISLSALGIYSLVSGAELNYILSMTSSALDGAGFSALLAALGGFVGVALIAVFVVLFSLLGFLSIKNMQKITCAIAALGVAACVADYILIARFASIGDGAILSGKSGFGLFVTAAMFVVVFVVNFLLTKKGIPVEYDEGAVRRVEIYKKVKSGQINLDDLPQPVVETAATREIDEMIAREEAAFAEKYGGKSDGEGAVAR